MKVHWGRMFFVIGLLLLIASFLWLRQDASAVHVGYWFKDAGGITYQLGMLGTLSNPDNWLPDPGTTATVTAAEGDNWTLSAQKKDKNKVAPESGRLEWTLKITRPN